MSVPRRVGTGSSRVGIVTDRDIAIRAVAEGVDPSAVTIADIASRDLVMVDPTRLCREGVSPCSGA
jgi:CBS domain-containing protein